MPAKVKGVPKLTGQLLRIEPQVRAKVAEELIRQVDSLVEYQQQQAPVDDGTLRASIRREDGEHELQQLDVAGSRKAFYARFVEFGTVKTPAQPFFYPMYRARKKGIKRAIARVTRKATRDAVRK